jgi:hypothetical protein
MSRDPRFIELDHHPQQGSPIERERVMTGPVIGVLAGLVIGIILDLMFDQFGARSNPLSVLAVPIAAAVIGLTMGMLLSVAAGSRLDAQVRDRRCVRPRRASTTERFDPAHRS